MQISADVRTNSAMAIGDAGRTFPADRGTKLSIVHDGMIFLNTDSGGFFVDERARSIRFFPREGDSTCASYAGRASFYERSDEDDEKENECFYRQIMHGKAVQRLPRSRDQS